MDAQSIIKRRQAAERDHLSFLFSSCDDKERKLDAECFKDRENILESGNLLGRASLPSMFQT